MISFFSLEKENGLSCFDCGKYDDAFKHFTNVLLHDNNDIEAMTKRAHIHFLRKEYEYCIIECEEIIKTQTSSEIEVLKESAKKEINLTTPWYQVLGVQETALRQEVEKTYRKLAGSLTVKGKKKLRVLEQDQKKMLQKLTAVNFAVNQYKNL